MFIVGGDPDRIESGGRELEALLATWRGLAQDLVGACGAAAGSAGEETLAAACRRLSVAFEAHLDVAAERTRAAAALAGNVAADLSLAGAA